MQYQLGDVEFHLHFQQPVLRSEWRLAQGSLFLSLVTSDAPERVFADHSIKLGCGQVPKFSPVQVRYSLLRGPTPYGLAALKQEHAVLRAFICNQLEADDLELLRSLKRGLHRLYGPH